MPSEHIETYRRDGKWRNCADGGVDLPGEYDVRETAVAVGHDEAVRRKAEHIVRKPDGTVEERMSYGHDQPQSTG